MLLNLEFRKEKSMGLLKCPYCGCDLELAIEVVGTNYRKIKKDGNLHKTINRCTAKPLYNAASYLKCTNINCVYTYDTEHASNDEPVEEFDIWIKSHLDEIADWSN